jgi:plasmid stabilization system protein ParE
VKVRLTAAAERDIEELVAYIQQRDEAAAGRVRRAIARASAGLGAFPLLGRPGRLANTRERPLARYPYTLIYRIYGERVFVLRVIHQRQQWPPEE